MTTGEEKILVRSVNWLGDAVMSVPALRRLREARPKSSISILTHEKLADLWRGQAFVDEVISFGARESVWGVAKRLRAERFEIALVFPNSVRSALETWLARIPRRIGFGRRVRALFLTEIVPPRLGSVPMRKRTPQEVQELVACGSQPKAMPASAHHVHHYLHIVQTLGASTAASSPQIKVDANVMSAVREKFGLVSSTRWLGLNPGAEYGPAKRWPAERFAETAKAVRQKTQRGIVIFGGPGDATIASQIAGLIGSPVVNLAGRTSLGELAAALKICDVVLTNDSGPMHLASAVGTRVVAIFGSTSPELTGPLGGEVIRQPPPCAPCFLRECPIDLRCLRSIESDCVIAALTK